MSENIRVLRILEYVGNRKWVEDTLSNSGVPLNGTSPNWSRDVGYIKSGMIGAFPDVIQDVVHPVSAIKQMLEDKIKNANNYYEEDIFKDILERIKDIEYKEFK